MTPDDAQAIIAVLGALLVLVSGMAIATGKCEHSCHQCDQERARKREAYLRRQHDTWHDPKYPQPGCDYCRQ